MGRSPHDDVVEGLGEAYPHEPEKQYDEKGRVINPQTKRTIKDFIRAHNEVMLVIGVAEPDNAGISEEQARLAVARQMYEADTGRSLLNVGRSLGILGIWGVHDGQPRGEAIPVGAIRRQSTFSSRGGEDYGTDEEDSEMINPTLISFDVDTSESAAEQHTGVWSAELRPSAGGDGRAQRRESPIYDVNPLTKLPSVLASDILTNFLAYLLCAPADAMALRSVARAFAQKRGLSCDGMFDVSLMDNVSFRGVLNIFGLEMLRLLISGDTWAMITILARWLHVTEEEWKDMQKEEGIRDAVLDGTQTEP
ncbi:hypothetical protein DL766_008215 [Monosporascus sp. MC13-8B]|uniref:Uncharacterized protein n=1 Tax=Monosporascus cannonballus TaxID=155416 RepID=A0ABY0H041_9PEZI|nr:hypothetical protein DL762_008214 [Monosporascus cannonballus]RYP20356.1 hypothetical protein DL766_008215 [Monosporascus sp. MC13-8B]